jgi:hypothetical protein
MSICGSNTQHGKCIGPLRRAPLCPKAEFEATWRRQWLAWAKLGEVEQSVWRWFLYTYGCSRRCVRWAIPVASKTHIVEGA